MMNVHQAVKCQSILKLCKQETLFLCATAHIRLHFQHYTRIYTPERLKNDLRSYLDYYEYRLGALQCHHMATDMAPVSESFAEEEHTWFFTYHRDLSKAKHNYNENISSPSRSAVPSLRKPTCRRYIDTEVPDYTCGSAKIFERGYDAISDYVEYGKDKNPSYITAFTALERFFEEKDYHERRLCTMSSTDFSETHVTSVLAQHLLSQLLPYPSNYFMDNCLPGKTDCCPCGCGVPTHFGLTYIGSPYLFHGRADIVLFPMNQGLFSDTENSKSAVFSLKKNEKDGHKMINNQWNSDEILSSDPAVVVTKILYLDGSWRQLCKQAVATSLCKYRRQTFGPSALDNGGYVAMVPVCALTKEVYEVAAYDAENDYLLKSGPLKIFNENHDLLFEAIIDLWLLTYHHIFCTKLAKDEVNCLKGTCNLIPQVGKDAFRTAVNNSAWLLSPDSISYPAKKLLSHPNDAEEESYIETEKKYPRKSPGLQKVNGHDQKEINNR